LSLKRRKTILGIDKKKLLNYLLSILNLMKGISITMIEGTKPKVAAIIPAAGSGKRMGSAQNKIWLQINGSSILEYTLKAFQTTSLIDRIVLVINGAELKEFETFLAQRSTTFAHPVDLAIGGAERQDSVANGLNFLMKQPGWGDKRDLVVIHDGARALVNETILTSAIEMAQKFRAVGVGVPVKDTIKQIDREGLVINTPERTSLWAMQTPQVFELNLLLECYQRVAAFHLKCTDDCSVVEACGYPVKLLMGSYENLKITTPEDLILAETILRRRADDPNRSGL
jgi:2-C-methyl-D-erythritol 4-phosphate cytidylyltransferase